MWAQLLLRSFYKASPDTPVFESSLSLYWLVTIILDIGYHILFEQVCDKGQDEEKHSFLPFAFIKKGIDANDLVNFVHRIPSQTNSAIFQKQSYTDYFTFIYFSYCIKKLASTKGYSMISRLRTLSLKYWTVLAKTPH